MIITRLGFSALVLAACCLGGAPALAQDINIYGGSDVVVPDAFDQASVYNGTYFQQVSLGDQKQYTVWVYNNDRDNNVVLDGPVTLTGAHPEDFEIYFPYDALAVGYYPLLITFKPTVAGPRSAIVTINNNTPGSKAAYSFSIGGVGVVDPVASTFDLTIASPLAGAKTKTKNGETKVRWKLKVYNFGALPTEGGLVAFYHSNDNYLSFVEDTFVSEKTIKPLPAMVEGKKTPRKKVKFKAAFNQENGSVFAVASGYPVFPIENELTDNIVRSGY